MELYFSPLACSLAARVALYEAGADAGYRQVDLRAKRVEDGSDFFAVNGMGQVPVLRIESDEIITENPAVLQFIADRYPAAELAPADGMERYRLQKWLSFIATELHKAVFIPLLDRTAPTGAKEFAREKAGARFDYLAARLEGREFLLDRFSVADCFLATVLNWAQYAGIDLARWPAVHAYFERMRARPTIAKAFAKELALYRAELARRGA